MKIKVYIITYDNNMELNKTLKTFEKSGILKYDYEIKIINNNKDSPVLLDDINLKVRVIDNNTRPSFSTGHLARNWNECLIDGFKDVENPDADIVILSQNDVDYNQNIIDTLVEYHKKYNFITGGSGDAFHSYTIDSIKSVGLWDERFCNIGWQEGDYFFRHLIYNGEKSSINDFPHDRVNNKIDFDFVDSNRTTGFFRNDPHHLNSFKYHEISMDVFAKKWGSEKLGCFWSSFSENNMSIYEVLEKITVKSPQWIMYPFFESKIENLNSKNYICYETSN